MASDDKLIIEVALQPSLDKKTTAQVKNKAEKVGKDIGNKLDSGVKKANLSIVNLGASLKKLGAIAGAIAIYKTFQAGINAAVVQENAVNRLNASLKVSGDYSLDASRSFQELASELQKLTRFGDEEILNQIALAKSFGATNAQAAQIAKTSLDLAEAFDIDLTSATRNAAKTLGGYAGELGEVIPELKDLTKQQLQAGKGIELLSNKFGGTAAERVKTFGNAVEQQGNAWSDLLEGFGQFVTDNPLILTGIANTTDYISTLASATKEAAGFVNSIFGKKEDVTRIDTINKKVAESVDEVQRLKRVLTNTAIQGTTQEKILKEKLRVAEIEEKALLRRRDVILKEVRAAEDANKKKKVIAGDNVLTTQQLNMQLNTLGLDRIQVLENQQAKQLDILNQAREKNLISIQDFQMREIEIREQFGSQIQAIEDQKVLNAEASTEGVSNAFKVLGKNAKITSGEIAKTVNNVLAKGLGNAFSSVGASIAKGENAMQAFADGIKNVFADLASALGDYYIKTGLARMAASYGADGGAVVAAGAALKLLGGFLSASGGGGGGTAGASDSGASSSALNTTTPAVEDQPLEERTNNTVINFNVEGSISAQDDFGRYISDVLSESNEKNGNVILNPRFA